MILLENNTGFLYQYEKGKRLIIHDADINSVGFSINKSTTTLMQSCYMDGSLKVVDIPASLLTEPGLLNVYGCHITETLDDVKIHRQYRIIERNKPSDYVDEEDTPRWIEYNLRLSKMETDLENGVYDGKDGKDGLQGPQGPKGDKGDPGQSIVGPQGPAGKDGKDGSDADVTKANIISALEYTPADQQVVNQLSDEKVNGTGIKNIVKLTQAEYDSMASHDENTLYVIVG